MHADTNSVLDHGGTKKMPPTRTSKRAILKKSNLLVIGNLGNSGNDTERITSQPNSPVVRYFQNRHVAIETMRTAPNPLVKTPWEYGGTRELVARGIVIAPK